MKKITTHSKSGLFLMEMIFVLLFLGLTCGVRVRLFAASYMARVHARGLVSRTITSAGKFWKELTARLKFSALMPDER